MKPGAFLRRMNLIKLLMKNVVDERNRSRTLDMTAPLDALGKSSVKFHHHPFAEGFDGRPDLDCSHRADGRTTCRASDRIP